MSNENDAFNALDSLSVNDLERVERLIQKLAGRKNAKTETEEPVRHGPRKRKNQKQTLDREPDERIIGKRRQGNRQSKTQQMGNSRRDQKGRQARIAPFETGPRENEFLDMRVAKSKNKDRKADLALAGDAEITPRGERSPFIEAQCQECQDYFDVSPEFVHYDSEKGKMFTCNECASSKR